jgi:hypothetical protein
LRLIVTGRPHIGLRDHILNPHGVVPSSRALHRDRIRPKVTSWGVRGAKRLDYTAKKPRRSIVRSGCALCAALEEPSVVAHLPTSTGRRLRAQEGRPTNMGHDVQFTVLKVSQSFH